MGHRLRQTYLEHQMPMTFDEAAKLLSEKGSLGRSEEWIKQNKLTLAELRHASGMMQRNGVSNDQIEQAKEAIIEHWTNK